jgi:hypothetical protein
MMGLAARARTDVDPTCSISSARLPSANPAAGFRGRTRDELLLGSALASYDSGSAAEG